MGTWILLPFSPAHSHLHLFISSSSYEGLAQAKKKATRHLLGCPDPSTQQAGGEACTPWPIPTQGPEEWWHVWGPWVAHKDQSLGSPLPVSKPRLQLPGDPQAHGMGWDPRQGLANGHRLADDAPLQSAAALGYSRLLSIANLKQLIFTACSYKFLKMSGPKLGQVSSRGFFGSFALPSRIYLPLPARQWGPCTRGKWELLSRALLLFQVSTTRLVCITTLFCDKEMALATPAPVSTPEASQGSKTGDHRLGPQVTHHLSAQLRPLCALPLPPALLPYLQGDPSGRAPLPSNVTSTSRHKTKWFRCLRCWLHLSLRAKCWV